MNSTQAAHAARRKARHFAMQALYQWKMSGSALNMIEAEFYADNDMSKADTEYFRELLHSVPAQLEEIEAGYTDYLEQRDADELDPVTQALLRMATYELMARIDVPYKVVINEAVSLAKKFGATDSYKFINGVLDKVAARYREAEIRATRHSG